MDQPQPERPDSTTSPAKRTWPWRPWLRALHRDGGYLAVGLTLIYALSGLAVNHISDWDPNFQSYSTHHKLSHPLQGDPQAIARTVLAELGSTETPREVYRASDTRIDIELDRRTLHVEVPTGDVLDEGQKPRSLLRLANWLHLNRGKKAWTFVADAYAIVLLYLAVSGLWMLPGRKGFFGRGAVLVLAGLCLPVAYVVWSGGPTARRTQGPESPGAMQRP